MIPEAPAERHRVVAARFAEVAGGVADWSAAAPVPGWAAVDVVGHLIAWSTGFLGAGGVELPPNPAVEPATRWDAHAASIQALLDGPSAEREFTHPMAGTHQLATAIDRFYTTDVFMHTWDLAQASGQDATLDAEEAERVLAGMQPIEEILRGSGQYGPASPVAPDASPTVRLMAFIGRTVP